MTRKIPETFRAMTLFSEAVTTALIDKFNRSPACAAAWAEAEIVWIDQMRIEGKTAIQAAHEVFMEKVVI